MLWSDVIASSQNLQELLRVVAQRTVHVNDMLNYQLFVRFGDLRAGKKHAWKDFMKQVEVDLEMPKSIFD